VIERSSVVLVEEFDVPGERIERKFDQKKDVPEVPFLELFEVDKTVED